MKESGFGNQVAIITGAGRGMGREMALLLARRGARVLVNDFGGDTDGRPGGSEVAEGVVAEFSNITNAVPVTSSTEENMRYTQWLPWTGGRAGTL